MILKINGKMPLYTEIPFDDAWNLPIRSIFGISKTQVLKPAKNVILLGERTYLLLGLYIICCEKDTLSPRNTTASFCWAVTWGLIKMEQWKGPAGSPFQPGPSPRFRVCTDWLTMGAGEGFVMNKWVTSNKTHLLLWNRHFPRCAASSRKAASNVALRPPSPPRRHTALRFLRCIMFIFTPTCKMIKCPHTVSNKGNV